MSHIIGKLPVRWSLQEIENLEFFYEDFNDPLTKNYWAERWGFDFRTGLQADFRSHQPIWIPQILQDLALQGISLDHVGTSFYKMRPGDILPRHQDTYARYCHYHQISPEQIWRVIVFLQDWQSGFICEVDDQSITGYKNGTYVIWHNDAPHLAGNIGDIPRYTLQITGTRITS